MYNIRYVSKYNIDIDNDDNWIDLSLKLKGRLKGKEIVFKSDNFVINITILLFFIDNESKYFIKNINKNE